MDNLVRRSPDLLPTEVASSNIVNKHSSFYRPNPHVERCTGVYHSERSHGRNAPQVTLSVVLLGVMRADKCTFNVTFSALINQISSDVFSDVIPYENQRHPIPTAEVGKGGSNAATRPKRENIPPMRSKVKISLPILVARIPRLECVSEHSFGWCSKLQITHYPFCNFGSLR
jgi:hypothetical protein